MDTNIDEQSMNLDEFITNLDIATHPAVAPLIAELSNIVSKNPQFTFQQVTEALGQHQSQGMAGHVQENHFKNEGLYVSDVQPEAVDAHEPQFQVHNQTSVNIEDHMGQLDLNSHGNNQLFTINMDALQRDPLDVQPRHRLVKNKKKAAGRSVTHDHQYSSTALGHCSSHEASLQTSPVSAGRVPPSQGICYLGYEVATFSVSQQHAMSIHPEVSPEMEDIFHPQHPNYLENDSLRLTESPYFPSASHPVMSLFPDDTFNTNTGHMSPLAVDGLKEESISSASPKYSFQLEGQYGSSDSMKFNDESSSQSCESSRAGTPAQSYISNSNPLSPSLQVHYIDGTPAQSPSTSNNDSLLSPAPSPSSSYTNPSPSPESSVRGRSRNSSGRRQGRPRRLSSSSSTSSPRQARMSLANMTKEQKHMRVRGQNNQASRDYRKRKSEKLAGLEAEVYLREQKKKEQMRVCADSEKKLKLLRQLLVECQKRGIFPNMVFSDHQ